VRRQQSPPLGHDVGIPCPSFALADQHSEASFEHKVGFDGFG
jgi:hypothetical protein